MTSPIVLNALPIFSAALTIFVVNVSISLLPDNAAIASSKPLPIASLDSSTATVNLAILPA